MTVIPAPLGLLPDPVLVIGEERLSTASGGVHHHIYPGTGAVTASLPLAGAAEIDKAVIAARVALPAWRATPVDERRGMLLRLATLIRTHSPELAELGTVDNGSPTFLSQFMPGVAADYFEYNAGFADKIGGEVIPTWPAPALDYSIEEPYGVVGIIIPWNGPAIATGMTCGPALAAGNCVLMKPPELTPWTVLRIASLALEAGFPPGVFQVLPGNAEAGATLVAHPGIDKIHFTGSGATATHILRSAAETLKPVGLELGGKSANLIFADADLPSAVGQAIGAIINLSGQGCINGTRVLVEQSIYDQVVEMAVMFLGGVGFGDPQDPMNMMGPVINATAVDRILGMIGKAKESGARLVLGGDRADGELADGFFVRPTVFADVDNSSYIAQHEVFGPVLAITPFKDEAEAIAMANATSYGLAAYIWSNDLKRVHRTVAALEAGAIWVNGFLGIPASAPFGGNKASGWGRLGGRDGIREFTRPKNVWINLS